MIKPTLPLILGLLVAVPISARSATIRVPADQPTIQAGINIASWDDTVLVAQGTYFESLIIPRRMALISESGPDVTTIDASAQAPVIIVEIPAERTTIAGFRIKNGFGSSGAHAGGIHVDVDHGVGGRAVIRNNVVEHNRSIGWVGGIFAVRASTVEDNVIQFNNRSAGKATSALEASGIVRRNVIRHNGDLGDLNIVHVHDSDTGPSTVEHNVIVDNASPVIHVLSMNGSAGTVVRHNTIANNGCGGFATVGIDGTGDFEFTHNIVSHICEGLGCDFRGGGVQNVSCNNSHGIFGESYSGDCADDQGINGNISEPPLFCDPTLGDYRLQSSSPCAPANSPPGCGLIGALPVCEATGIEATAPSQHLALRVEPNPASVAGADFVLSHELDGAAIEIYDSAGRLIDMLRPTGTRIRWAGAGKNPRGVYFARLSSGGSAEVVKFVLVH